MADDHWLEVARRLRARVDRRAKKAGFERRPRPNRGRWVASVIDLMSGNPYAGLWASLRCIDAGSRLAAPADDTEPQLRMMKVETDATPVLIEVAD